MRLRTYLLIANGMSIAFILISLLFSYYKMYLSLNETIWLSSVTLGAGFFSLFIHYLLTRPVEKSIHLLSLETKKLAEGNFHGRVPATGPYEFQMLAHQFNEMSDKLEQSFLQLRSSETSRRELIANVSHDLRTPLASIQSFVEALQDDVVQDDQTFKRYLNTIGQETKRLGSLIEDLFQLSRLESEAEAFEPVPYHIDNFILECLQSHELLLENKNVEVAVDIPERLPVSAMMPLKMKQLFTNLLHNAIRHSYPGGIIHIQVTEVENHFIRVSIADNGEGISQEDCAYIFDRFYRTDKSRNRESGGAGLGLAICQSIIKLHGGQIGVDSTLGKGSTFWFTLPQYGSKFR